MSSVPGLESGHAEGGEIGWLLIHPVLDAAYVASEHPQGQLDSLGDALGTDFMVIRWRDGWARLHGGDGRRNEDWFGWRANVLAPVNGEVVDVKEPSAVNRPGERGDGSTTGAVTLRRDDDVFVVLAHLQEIRVEAGDPVTAGQVIAAVGNNGVSWTPHVHVGAWMAGNPLQLRVDLAALGRIMRERGEAEYYGLPSGLASSGT